MISGGMSRSDWKWYREGYLLAETAMKAEIDTLRKALNVCGISINAHVAEIERLKAEIERLKAVRDQAIAAGALTICGELITRCEREEEVA